MDAAPALDLDLDLPGPPAATRVVVAMSGGVDSSVTAALLAEAGYDVVGITLQLYDHGAAAGRRGACCAGRDVHDARDAAERIGIPHYVLDYESAFRRSVIEAFADAYARGETPVPCVACNRTVKFRDLLGTARDLGAAALCTGHYARRTVGPDGPELRRAADPAKDQSYFLYATTAGQLAFLRFPLGGMAKAETRAHARRLGLDIADKPDSQDICFVPDGRYVDTVRRLRPDAAEPGEIVDLDGRPLGVHGGIAGYTVGQRRGLGIGGRRGGPGGGSGPLYVVRVEPETRRVAVGPRAALARDTVEVADFNWIAGAPPAPAGARASVRLRSTQAPVPGTLFPAADGRARVRLDAPVHGVAPGQAAVCYDPEGDRVLGGGRIAGASLGGGGPLGNGGEPSP